MIKRKLLIGLSAAVLFLGGIAALVSLPASASTHYLVTLPNGQTMEVDVPEGQTVEQVVGGPVLSATPTSDPTQAPAAAPEPLPEAPSQPATASEPASQPASEPAAQPAAEPAPAAAPEQAPAPAPAKQAQPAAPASSSQTPTEEPKVAAEEQQQTTGRVKANPRSKDEASSKSGSDDAKGKDDAKKHDADGTATDARQQAPTAADPGFSLALPGPGPHGRPQLLHRQVPDPAVPAPDLPGGRHRVRRALGGPGGDQRDRDGLRPQPERLHRRRRRVDAVPAVELEALRRRRQPRRAQGPVQPGRRHLRHRPLPEGRGRRRTTCARRSSPTTTPTGTSTASSCARV
jgi:outer membrane biosynthesis protein TonB